MWTFGRRPDLCVKEKKPCCFYRRESGGAGQMV
jgi:hypothetical protein